MSSRKAWAPTRSQTSEKSSCPRVPRGGIARVVSKAEQAGTKAATEAVKVSNQPLRMNSIPPPTRRHTPATTRRGVAQLSNTRDEASNLYCVDTQFWIHDESR